LFVPEFTPFTFHWNDGFVPGFIGTAVNMTDVPAQTVVEEALMVTLTGRGLFTVIMMEFEAVGLSVTQGRSEVRMH